MKGLAISLRVGIKGFRMNQLLEDLTKTGIVDPNGMFTEDHFI
ncbi:hypothetical protein [Carnobacterium jeotgali]